jgi:hypothetical protein
MRYADRETGAIAGSSTTAFCFWLQKSFLQVQRAIVLQKYRTKAILSDNILVPLLLIELPAANFLRVQKVIGNA